MDSAPDGGCLAVAERSALIEEYHPGAVAVVDSKGELVAAHGDVLKPFFIRSSAKPFQALAALATGLDVPDTHLALACSSHSADPVHVAIVRDMLSRAGLGVEDLQTPPARPLGDTNLALAAKGDVSPSPLFHNCSGKHAAMLAACVEAGWDTSTYLQPDHPLQQSIYGILEQVVQEDIGPPGIDGCGAPVWRTNTVGLARAFSHLENDDRFARIRLVMGRYPLLVSGEGREDALIGRWLGTPTKAGASGCMGVAVAGHGIAAKAWTGIQSVAGIGIGLGLDHLGVLTGAIKDGLGSVLEPPVLGGGKVVGRIRPSAVLETL